MPLSCRAPNRTWAFDKRKATGYTPVGLKIRSFSHKGLQGLYEKDNAKGVPPDTADKLRKMFAYLDQIADSADLYLLPVWRPHRLTGDRNGTWSLSVTGNRRLTFRVDEAENEIIDVNLEDYH